MKNKPVGPSKKSKKPHVKQNTNSGKKRKLPDSASVNSAVEETTNDEKTPTETTATPAPQLSLDQASDIMAELGESILENPQNAFRSQILSTSGSNQPQRGPSAMRQLLALAHQKHNDDISKLAIISLLAIFRDILPTYRIRLPTEAERNVKVSKETKQLWDYERNLLHHYQEYIVLLEKTWNGTKNSKGTPSRTTVVTTPLQVTCLLALCQLLPISYNFRSQLLTTVTRHMTTGRSPATAAACCQAVRTVFSTDKQGVFALETARGVTKTLKNAPTAAALRTFLALPLTVHADEAEAAAMAAKANKKRRKQDKERAAIEAEQRESEAVVDKQLLARCQSETLQTITLTYFQILKDATSNKADDGDDKAAATKRRKASQLLPAALEGLAQFSHLINMDTVMDLLGLFKELLKEVDTLPLDAALNCIQTAFMILQGPGQTLQIDVKDYIAPLYRQIPRVASEKWSWSNDWIQENENGEKKIGNSDSVQVLLRCLTLALIDRREFSRVRVASFFQQLLGTALHAPSYTAVPLLAFSRQLISRYGPALEHLLENEADVVASGDYESLLTTGDPEYVTATQAWELSLAKCHIHPVIAAQATLAASNKLIQFPKEAPKRLRDEAVEGTKQVFIPYHLNTKRHPLASKMGNKKQRQQERFITPRRTENRLVSDEDVAEYPAGGFAKLIGAKNEL